jgi:hypothetical protein
MRGELHHVEMWVPDLSRAIDSLGWLLTALGSAPYQDWAEGRSCALSVLNNKQITRADADKPEVIPALATVRVENSLHLE